MKSIKEHNLIIIGTFLCIALLCNFLSKCSNSKINNNLKNQINQSLKLIEAYGRVNAYSLEYIEMLNYHEHFSKFPGFWEKLIKNNTPLLDQLSESVINEWSNKKTIEYFKFKLKPLMDSQKNWQNKVNILFKNQTDYISRNKKWDSISKISSLIEFIFICLALLFYGNLMIKLSVIGDGVE